MEERYVIRDMTPEHCDSKGYVHYKSWQETYRGLLDDRILDRQTLENCQISANRYPQNTLVLLDRNRRDRVVGFACYIAEARDFFSVSGASEVMAIYLLEQYKGLGLGRRLMEACLERLPHPSVVLLVLEGNTRAIGFYEHMGFRLTGHRRTERISGAEMTELEMLLQRG